MTGSSHRSNESAPFIVLGNESAAVAGSEVNVRMDLACQ